jgi:hypothetical protein
MHDEKALFITHLLRERVDAGLDDLLVEPDLEATGQPELTLQLLETSLEVADDAGHRIPLGPEGQARQVPVPAAPSDEQQHLLRPLGELCIVSL